MRRYLFAGFILFSFLNFDSLAQTDEIGSGRALQMDGIDDYIDLGNIYDNLSLPVTVSAWVLLDGSISNWAPVFVSQDNSPIYNGFWFIVQPTTMAIGYGDGLGENDPAFRRGKTATFPSIANRWVHITGIIRAGTDMDLYVNGINVGGAYSGSTNLPMSSTAADIAKIGYWYSNGQVTRFKGKLDEIRVWNRSLSQDEVRSFMCKKVIGNENGLIGVWSFNELTGSAVIDNSANHFNGVLKNSPARGFSGAAIGDRSLYQYVTNWSGITVTLTEANDNITVKNIRGSPEGIHVYEVSSLPSQNSGLQAGATLPYFGVFTSSLDDNNLFDLYYTYNNIIPCTIFNRRDNSIALWADVNSPAQNMVQRGEFIKLSGEKIALNLGADKILCNQTSLSLVSNITDISFSYLWNTGESSSAITVSQSGKYWLKILSSCGMTVDTVNVKFSVSPSPFSIGGDEQVCPLAPRRLQPYSTNLNDLDFTWQDGSKQSYFDIKVYGTYWVVAKNYCGEVSDSVTFSKPEGSLDEIPNVITPNGDAYNQYFSFDSNKYGPISLLIINRWGKRVFYSNQYRNDWDGNDLSSGIYFYTIAGNCIEEIKGTVSVIR